MTTDLVARYRPDARSPGQARSAVRAFCKEHDFDGLQDDAELLASEVMTNACRMATEPVTMVLVADDESLVVIIGDNSTNPLPAARRVSDPLAESGRGLYVVDQLASAWGTSKTGDRKNVWFRLP